MNIKTTLNEDELLAIEFHMKLDKKMQHTDKHAWPAWFIEKIENAVNNPFKQEKEVV